MRVKALAVVSFMIVALAAPAAAAEWKVGKEVPFELGTWIDLAVTDGPATLHRIRVAEYSGAFKASDLMRPLSPDYMKTVRIELEYSNAATRDWAARMVVEWFDADGTLIDGYNGEETLDDRESHDLDTVTWATLKYGLARAKTLKVKIDMHAD
ncbi:MAG: hypothetical protein HY825_05635 [Acidobacteria bacterium]|nr:hypothetical protein [Acidobacteriota bacterium]